MRRRWPRKNAKYGAVRTNGFASKREAAHYQKLKLLEQAGEIRDLQQQVRFNLVVNDKKICAYVADFTYRLKDGKAVIDETKGYKTDVFKLKWKLLQALHGDEFIYVLS